MYIGWGVIDSWMEFFYGYLSAMANSGRRKSIPEALETRQAG